MTDHPKIIHYGNSNIRRMKTTCGAVANMFKDSININDVNCLACVSRLAFPDKVSNKTQEWKERLEVLKMEKQAYEVNY